jgi:hypothetical protein
LVAMSVAVCLAMSVPVLVAKSVVLMAMSLPC